MSTDRTTRAVGAGVGLVHVQVGAGTLPMAFEVPVRVLAVAAFLGIVGVGQRWGGREAPPDRSGDGPGTAVARSRPFELAALRQRPAARVLGGATALCWAAGLALALDGAPTAVAGTVAGIVPGTLLLGSVWWWSARPRRVPGRTTT